MSARAIVIGVGNAHRGDDAVGLEVLRALRDRVGPDVRLVRSDAEPASLLDAWTDADLAILVDAMRSGAAIGTVRRFQADAEPLPIALFARSTHDLGVADAVELARALRRLPDRVVVYGVEGRAFDAGTALTPEVARSIETTAIRVLSELGAA